MSTEEVSVSLSRLALAKAIKTPDTNEEEAEPWSKSVIFHQSHIDAQMRNSIINPMSNKNRRRPPPQHFKQQQKHMAPPMNRGRSEELYKQPPRSYPQQRSTSALNHQQRASTSQSSSSGNSSLSSGKLAQHNITKTGRRYIPSDDEEEEDDDDDEDSKEDSEDEDEVQAPKIQASKPKIAPKLDSKPKHKKIEPSDEEEESVSSDDKEDDKASKEKGKEPESDETYARRMSTLRQLEQGTSTIRKSKSTDEGIMVPPSNSFTELPITDGKLGSIEQWRMTVLEADDTLSTPGSDHDSIPSRPSTTTSSSLRQSHMNKRTSTMSDMYYLQQQQHMYHTMQLQQAMQMQQMMQIQQYQQQAAIHQYRNSVMMDPYSRQPRTKKHSHNSSRLLNNVPEHGIPRSSHRRSQMMDGPPMPMSSMSTPVHRRTAHQQQQHMMMQPPMPVMKPSRSSHMSKRTSRYTP